MTVEAVFRREYGRCLAALIRFLGDIDAAEEAVQEAFTVAVAKFAVPPRDWPRWPSFVLWPLDSYYLFHAARADMLRRLGRDEEAAAAYHVARSLTANQVEQALLDAQHAAVLGPGVD